MRENQRREGGVNKRDWSAAWWAGAVEVVARILQSVSTARRLGLQWTRICRYPTVEEAKWN